LKGNNHENIQCRILRDILAGSWRREDPFPDDWLIEHVLNEERAYTNPGIGIVVTGFTVPCILSVRKVGIPLVYIIPGTCLPAYFKAGLATFPDAFENTLLEKFVPAEIVNKMVDLAVLHRGTGYPLHRSLFRKAGCRHPDATRAAI
jgi:hypothetical protein